MQTFQCCLSAWPGELTATLPKRVFLFSICVCRWPSLGFPAWKPNLAAHATARGDRRVYVIVPEIHSSLRYDGHPEKGITRRCSSSLAPSYLANQSISSYSLHVRSTFISPTLDDMSAQNQRGYLARPIGGKMPPRGESQNALLADRQVRAVRFFWRFVHLAPTSCFDPSRWMMMM